MRSADRNGILWSDNIACERSSSSSERAKLKKVMTLPRERAEWGSVTAVGKP